MKTLIPETTIGIDLGDKKHAICAINKDGEVLKQRSINNNETSLTNLSKQFPKARIVMETGTHSPWISRLFERLGHEVLVANARKLKAIYTNTHKSDEVDSMILARLGRFDPKLLHPIKHRSEQSHRDLLQIKLRDCLVRERVNIINSVRGTLKSLGIRTKSPSTKCFSKQARQMLATTNNEVLELIEPALQIIDSLSEKIKELDKAIELLAQNSYPITQKLQQINGVGALTALTFVLTIDDPNRFTSSRSVGAYLGLTPRRDQSGDRDIQLPITKAGDTYLRRLLVGAAQYALGAYGKDCYLRSHGLLLAERGGKRAKNKAVIAIARKMAVLMHSLMVSEQDYDPQLNASAA